MKTPMLPIALLALSAFGLAACKPEPPPTDDPPQPQAAASATELRDAIKQPIDQAKAVEAASLQAADEQNAAVDAATH